MPTADTVIKKRLNENIKDIETKPKKKHGVRKVVLRICMCFATVLLITVGGLLGVVYTLECGPSETARDTFVISMLETSAAKFVPNIFLSQQQIDEIVAKNTIKPTDEITDTGLVVITEKNEGEQGKPKDETIDPDGDGIDIFDFSGATYKGKMMVVYDPSRVFVGISGPYGATEPGKTLIDIYNSYDNIIAGVNGGGFDDRAGHGTGGEPWGIVMSQGEVLWGTPMYNQWETIGITRENKLVVGMMTIQKAVDIGVRDAVKFGPILIVNGEPVESLGIGGGLNPRTAIGQRADGAILLMTIDGRQSNSLGASYIDIQNVMLEYGAINAANLDGGSSTNMMYKGEVINQGASVVGYRRMCTAILVRGPEE